MPWFKYCQQGGEIVGEFALVVLSRGRKITFCEEIHVFMRGAHQGKNLSFAHTCSGGVYAFVQGELLGLLCYALVVCSFATDGVEPFCLPCEESVACELCFFEWPCFACSSALVHLDEFFYFSLSFMFFFVIKLVTMVCCQYTHQGGDWGPWAFEDRWMVAP